MTLVMQILSKVPLLKPGYYIHFFRLFAINIQFTACKNIDNSHLSFK